MPSKPRQILALANSRLRQNLPEFGVFRLPTAFACCLTAFGSLTP